jgi:hypothetical protein
MDRRQQHTRDEPDLTEQVGFSRSRWPGRFPPCLWKAVPGPTGWAGSSRRRAFDASAAAQPPKLLGSCPAGIGRCGGRGWSTLQPVGQRPAAEALHQVGALPQSPAGRGSRAARFGPTGSLLQGPGGDRHRHGDERQLPRPPPCSGPHAHASSRCHQVDSWSDRAASAPAG